MDIHVSLTPEQLKRIDEIAELDAKERGDKPNRSKSLARLINAEYKRRQKRDNKK